MNDIFESRGKPNIEKLKQHFLLEGRVTDDAALKIINDGAALLREEGNVLEIDAPVTGLLDSIFSANSCPIYVHNLFIIYRLMLYFLCIVSQTTGSIDYYGILRNRFK